MSLRLGALGVALAPWCAAAIDLFAPQAQRDTLLRSASQLKKLPLSEEEYQWLHVLAEGWADPLDGFMTEEQYLQSLHYQHLVINGAFVPMPVPIVKACTAEQKAEIDGAEDIALTGPDGAIVATMSKPKVGPYDGEGQLAHGPSCRGPTRGEAENGPEVRWRDRQDVCAENALREDRCLETPWKATFSVEQL